MKERNRIIDSKVVEELKGSGMKEVVVEQRFMDNHQCNDIRWMAKIEGKNIEKICKQSLKKG